MAQGASQSLSEALARFLATLKEEEQQEAQQELSRFVRWCGRDRRTTDISPPEIGDYAEWYVSGNVEGVKRLAPVKRFLSYLYRQGLTGSNLSVHLKVARGKKRPQRARARPVQKASLTKKGFDQLRSQLELLKEERVKVVGDIKRAMADKDFRENAPLDAAKEQQGFLESRIQELEEMLATAEVAGERAPEPSAPRVRRGCRVTLSDVSTGRQFSYTLVDPREADPASGKVSFASPVGQALLEHTVGEEVSISVPRGTLRFRIEKVEF